jgi:hypothetical protein
VFRLAQETLQVDTLIDAGSFGTSSGSDYEGDVSDNDDGTYNTCSSVSTIIYQMRLSAALRDADTINFVRLVARFAKGSGGQARALLTADTTLDPDGTVHSGNLHVSTSAAFADFSDDFDTFNGEGAWSKSLVDALAIRIQRTGVSTALLQLSKVYAVVDYTPAATSKTRRGFGLRFGSRTARA